MKPSGAQLKLYCITMRTAIRIFIFLISASAGQVMAQGADSVYRNTLFERYWTKPRLIPKAGFTILGFADLFYGYSIPLSKQTIDSVSRNRLSLLINLNRDYFNIKEARRKK